MSRRRAAATPAAPERARLIADVYACHAARLQAIVATKAHAPAQTVEDACQTAWAILLRRPDVRLDERGFAWLAVVATREAWTQASVAREVPMGAMRAQTYQPGELPEPEAITQTGVDELAADRFTHAQRIADLRAIKPNERTALYLQALGYRYREIAKATGASYTAVNRRLTEGRARLRRRARDRDDQSP